MAASFLSFSASLPWQELYTKFAKTAELLTQKLRQNCITSTQLLAQSKGHYFKIHTDPIIESSSSLMPANPTKLVHPASSTFSWADAHVQKEFLQLFLSSISSPRGNMIHSEICTLQQRRTGGYCWQEIEVRICSAPSIQPSANSALNQLSTCPQWVQAKANFVQLGCWMLGQANPQHIDAAGTCWHNTEEARKIH